MTVGVGGSSFEAELARMVPMLGGVTPIGAPELRRRVEEAQRLMRAQGVEALYLDTSTNLAYFTGIGLKPTKRLHGAVIPADGEVAYLSPAFEEPKTRACLRFGDDIRCWEEHEDPTALVVETVRSKGYNSGTVAIDPATPFFTVDGLRKAGNSFAFASAGPITAACRQVKSPAEIALMQRANDITLAVHKAAARAVIEAASFGPGYKVPGLPHRTAPHRPRHRPGRARGRLHGPRQQDAARARPVLLHRADNLHLRRVRRPAGGHRPHDRGRPPLVHPALPLG